MLEILRLQTNEYEFSILTSGIDKGLNTYQETLIKRSGNIASSNSQVRISPSINLKELIFPFFETNDFKFEKEESELISAISLPKPLFFENTQYHFQWIFFDSVTKAHINHRNRSISEAFGFSAKRGRIPAILTGTINTANDVGWMQLPLHYEIEGKSYLQHFAFEVLPTKMLLNHDLPAMYKAIDDIYPLWRFSLSEKTEQSAAYSKNRVNFPLMWLANFTNLRKQFEQGLKVICSAPHARLSADKTLVKAEKLKGHFSHKLGEKIKQDFANGRHEKRYILEKKKLSTDTSENRFIKMATHQCKRQLAEFESKLRLNNRAPDHQRFSKAFLNELHSWQQPLQKVLNQSFLKEVGAFSGLKRESLVLQQKTGYSTVYRVWQELKFYLNLFGNQSNISMKSVAEIYEIWCFLCIKQILEQELEFTLKTNKATKLTQNQIFEYQMQDGFAGAFEFIRSDGVKARLAHEPKFTKVGKPIRSFIVNQEPDIVLEVTLPNKKNFLWIFDAKYRIKTTKSRFDKNHGLGKEDFVPDDAINQMHRYRDALIHFSDENNEKNKSRPVVGAFALYPGFFDQNKELNPYAEYIKEIGIGAFALLPNDAASSNSGHFWLLEFLKGQIGTIENQAFSYKSDHLAEKHYVQEASRIPYHGMKQVLYSDLTLTISLGNQEEREASYFEKFNSGQAMWYHIPQKTFVNMFRKHVVNEIRFLALATTNPENKTKEIIKIWPIKSLSLKKRNQITFEQAGKHSDSDELYYLFELGKPLSLQNSIIGVPCASFRASMKLTTLSKLEKASSFNALEVVYKEAIADH